MSRVSRSRLGTISSLSKRGSNNRSRLLNQQQLIILRNAIQGSIFDTPDDRGFQSIKTLVEVATGISPKFFSNFIDGLSQGTKICSGKSGN